MSELPHATKQESQFVGVIGMVRRSVRSASQKFVVVVYAPIALIGEIHHPFQRLYSCLIVELDGMSVI